jgi:uncharacterized protein
VTTAWLFCSKCNRGQNILNSGVFKKGAEMKAYADTIPMEQIVKFCRRWKIQELALFGSALRDDFDATSDVDILVDFADDAQWSLLDHVQMERELGSLLAREIDLISKRAVEQSQNWIRRKEILGSAQVLFSAHETHYASG